ncbi:MAG: hypothetical protein JSW23_00230 [Planctomycetota bacterium]|nr:MAG: hypothetical protein JSW23_00230 [Planctomycetota bacterium]
MARFEEFREALGQILQERPNCYWLGYQIVEVLRERNPEILGVLEKKFATSYGRGGGDYYSTDSAIAHCLQDWPECVDVQYLLGRELQIGDVKASDEVIAIYRWIG